MVSVDTTIGDEVPELDPDTPPLLDVQVAVYPVMTVPPVPADPVNVTLMLALPCTTVGCAGVVGTVAGTVAVEGRLCVESPSAFVARTLHV